VLRASGDQCETLNVAATIGKAQFQDFDAVCRLLQQHHLPLDGLHEHLATTVVARDADAIVGSAALEVYREGALLRSVAVAAGRERRGLGRELTAAALRVAQDLHMPAVFLLTTTAEQYFPRFGFTRINRGDVPESVQASIEFTAACPSSATVMRKLL
jgi:amino-acid N-acetyltransferase